MDIDITKNELENLIAGHKIPMGGIAIMKYGTLTPFCGNQHNPNWKWDREKLSDMSEDELFALLNSLRKLSAT